MMEPHVCILILTHVMRKNGESAVYPQSARLNFHLATGSPSINFKLKKVYDQLLYVSATRLSSSQCHQCTDTGVGRKIERVLYWEAAWMSARVKHWNEQLTTFRLTVSLTLRSFATNLPSCLPNRLPADQLTCWQTYLLSASVTGWKTHLLHATLHWLLPGWLPLYFRLSSRLNCCLIAQLYYADSKSVDLLEMFSSKHQNSIQSFSLVSCGPSSAILSRTSQAGNVSPQRV